MSPFGEHLNRALRPPATPGVGHTASAAVSIAYQVLGESALDVVVVP